MPTDLAEELSRFPGTSSTSNWLTINSDHLREFAHSTYLDPASVDTDDQQDNVLGPTSSMASCFCRCSCTSSSPIPLSDRVGL